jgi:O-antigen ligase
MAVVTRPRIYPLFTPTPGVARRARSLSADLWMLLVSGTISALIVIGMALGIGPLTSAAAYAALLTGLVSPSAGLAILAFMAPLRPPLVVPAPGFDALLAMVTVAGCIYRLPIDRPTLHFPLPLVLLLTFGAYITVQQLPEMLAGYPGDEGHAVGYYFGQALASFGLILAAAYVLRDRSPAPFLAAVLFSAFVAAILAFSTSGTGRTGPLDNLVGVSDATARAVGPFADPNYFAVFQGTAIALAIAWAVVVRSSWFRLFLLGTATVLLLTFAITLSRGGLLALLAGLLVLAFTRSRRTGVIAVGAAIVFFLVVFPIYVGWRVTADTGAASAQAYASLADSDQARAAAALAAPQMFATSPIFGIGFGHYAFMSGWFVGYAIESHNWYLDVLAEEGLVGAALWGGMLVTLVATLYRVSRPGRLVGYAVLATYALGCISLQPPESFQTSALTELAVVAAAVGDWSLAAPRSLLRRPAGEGGAVQGLPPVRNDVDLKRPADMRSPRGAHRLPVARVKIHDVRHRPGEGHGIPGGSHVAGHAIQDGVATPSYIGGGNRQGARSRLQEDHRQSFPLG